MLYFCHETIRAFFYIPIFGLIQFKPKQAGLGCAVGGQGIKAHLFYFFTDGVAAEALVIICNLYGEDFAALGFTFDAVVFDKGLRQMKFILLQRIVTGHVVIQTIEVAVENQANAFHIGVFAERIGDRLAESADV